MQTILVLLPEVSEPAEHKSVSKATAVRKNTREKRLHAHVLPHSPRGRATYMPLVRNSFLASVAASCVAQGYGGHL